MTTSLSEDLIPVDRAGTLDGLFRERVRRSAGDVAYMHYDKPSGEWVETTWRDMAQEVGRWQAALAKENLKPGDRVAICLRNCREWVQFDQAALGMGLVDVPLYTDDRPDNVAYILRDSATKLLLLQSVNQWTKLAPVLGTGGPLRRVVILWPGKASERAEAAKDERVVFADEWLPETGQMQHRKGDPHALSSIVYTSGTTGRPKGVMLSHHNMLSVAHSALTMVTCYQQDVFLSFLPLSHTLERTGGYYLPMLAGASVAYARSVGQLGEDLQAIKPTVIIAVPRVFERIYGRMQQQMEKKSQLARILFNAAVKIGWRRFEVGQGRARPNPGLWLWPLLDRLVARKVRDRLGGRMRMVVSGGAALPLPVAKTFVGLGITLLQGYGLTEAAPVVSVNIPEDNDPSGVGVPLRGLQLRIGDNDELLVKSPGVMLGYWNNHAASAAAIDHDGWLHTGDQARLENGHVYITGRIKDILVLSNGEKVPPGDMEMAIMLDPLFEQALVVGEGKSYLTALLVLNEEQWVRFARAQGADPFARSSLNDPKVCNAVIARLRGLLKQFPGYAKIRRVSLYLEPWTIENDLMTPTMKIKRAKVLEHHAADIEELYKGDGAPG